MADAITLLINGYRYGGWQEISIERGVDRCDSAFNLAVSERWAGQNQPWRINKFDRVQVSIGPDQVLDGFVGGYAPSFDRASRGVRITGHSKTHLMVKCNMDIKSGQFSGYPVEAIAKAVAALYKIGVVVQTELAAQVVPNTKIERSETAWRYIERLCRLCGVLACDDEQGNLLLTTAGAGGTGSALVQGENLISGHAELNGEKQFSNYIVIGQAGIGYGSAAAFPGFAGSAPAPTGGVVQTQLRAEAVDPSVPLYAPRVTLAEGQMTQPQMLARANWQRNFSFGQATKAHVRVAGFRQPDGTLWRINQLVPVTSDWLGVDQDLLVARVKYTVDESTGFVTDLDLGPIQGYTPDPASLKQHKAGGKAKSGVNWTGFGGGH